MKTHLAGASQTGKRGAIKQCGKAKALPHLSLNVPLTFVGRELGVDHTHLGRVIRGERSSPELLTRYNEWCAALKALRTATATA